MNISKMKDKIGLRGYPSPLRLLVVIATAVFVAEFSIMTFFDYFPIGNVPETIIDATLLTFIILPILYYFSYRPFLIHINDLKSAEEELINFATAIDHGMEIIVITDPTGKVTYINPIGSKITGLSWNETVGRSVDALAAGRSKNHLFDRLSEAVESKIDFSGDFTIEKEGGRKFFGVARISPVKSISGKTASYVCICRDVTAETMALTENEKRLKELRESEERWRIQKETAETATKIKDKFVSIVSHDLREPLSSILGFAQLMRKEDGSKISDQSRSWLEFIELSAKKIGTIIDELLNTATLRTGKINPTRSFLDAHSLVSEAVQTLDIKANLKGVKVVNEIPRKTRIYADKTLCERVIQNLLSNAIKFSEIEGTVRIYLPAGKSATIAISDEGEGVNPDFIGDIFKYEKRTTSRGTTGEAGTGLGLPFVNEIMTAHGGTIFFETAAGKGTTFFASFPNVRPFVLLVEENPTTTKLVRHLLAPINVEFDSAADGKSAIEKISERKPDLIITDLNLPEINGFELIKSLKSNEASTNIPILVLTSLGKEEREKVLQLGADDFLAKSSAESDLVLRVRKIIN